MGPVRAHGQGTPYELADAARWVDPASGELQVRFVNERQDQDRLPVPDRDRGDRPMTGIVRATGLVKRYDRTARRRGLDLDVAEGEIFGLVGPNGAGKTTTLRILATLLVPDRGDAEIAGASVRRNPNDVRRVLGFMPDSFGVYDDMKVWEYLDFFARCYGIPAERRRRMIGDLLELVDLGSKRDTYVQGLSRGHAAAPVPRPRARPRPAGPAPRRAGVRPRPARPGRAARAPPRAAALGKTILVSSHILPELEELCTSVAIIDRGQVLAHGRVADIERRLRVGAVLRVRVLGDDDDARGRAGLVRRPAGRRHGGPARRRHDRDRLPRRRRRLRPAAGRTRVGAGLRVATFARAASDLEELFLQVTAPDPVPAEASA